MTPCVRKMFNLITVNQECILEVQSYCSSWVIARSKWMNVYFFMISMRAILASTRANLISMQFQGPQPKGMWQVLGRFAFSLGENLRERVQLDWTQVVALQKDKQQYIILHPQHFSSEWMTVCNLGKLCVCVWGGGGVMVPLPPPPLPCNENDSLELWIFLAFSLCRNTSLHFICLPISLPLINGVQFVAPPKKEVTSN